MDNIAHFRGDFGVPVDFFGVKKYPRRQFRLAKMGDGVRYLGLLEWSPSWAVTELERKVVGEREEV